MSLFKSSILHDASALSAELRAAIEEAYIVFAGHFIGIPLGVCKCNVCCNDAHERLLVTTPLRQLSSVVLSEYTNSAHGYDEYADGHALRYYLPRYFELIALNDPPHYGDLPHCLVRLGDANYRQHWSAKETDIIDRLFDALLRDKHNDVSVILWPVGYRLAYPITELIEMFVLGGGDIDRLLNTWEQASGPGPSVHIAAMASELHSRGGHMVFQSRVLGDYADACLAVGQFICRREQVDRLERAFFLLSDRPELQTIVSDGQGLLESMSSGHI